MSRFTAIIQNLHLERITLVQNNQKKKKGSGRRKPPVKKMTFASPELEAIFNSFPDSCKDLLRKGR